MSNKRASKKSSNTLDPRFFLEDPEVKKLVQKAKQIREKGITFSDVVDAEGHQYVNLVQKGGGVLGVALVGYTYILEQAGIRFLRLAGTSAGAINTALLAVIGEKQEPKSEKILKLLCELRLFDLVDGHFAARFLIRNLISNEGYAKRLKGMAMILLATWVFLPLACFIFLGLEGHFVQLVPYTQILFALLGLLSAINLSIIFYVTQLLNRFKYAGLGINPGNFFYTWIKNQFLDNKV